MFFNPNSFNIRTLRTLKALIIVFGVNHNGIQTEIHQHLIRPEKASK